MASVNVHELVAAKLESDGYPPEHAARHADALIRFATAPPVPLPPALAAPGAKAPAPVREAPAYNAPDVRAWCLANGIDVRPKGRISPAALAAYEAAH